MKEAVFFDAIRNCGRIYWGKDLVLKAWAISLCLVMATLTGTSAFADVVARVLAVSDDATLRRGAKSVKLVKNFGLESGDKISTSASGEVQIVFVDRTRILVGPNSEFHVQNVKMTKSNKARKFAVRALGGSFRFLSGDSKKSAYKIRTPSVTMGIRGTEFDFVVPNRTRTRVVAFSGQVQVCNKRNACSSVRGGCELTSVFRSRFFEPKTNDDRLTLLATEFPLVTNQSRYNRDFRVQVEECGGVEAATKAVRSSVTARPKAVEVEITKAAQIDNSGEIFGDSTPEPEPEAAPEPTYDESADES